MRTWFLLIGMMMMSQFSTILLAQDVEIFTEISLDTILAGNNLTVRFKVKGGAIANFKGPEFTGFEILAGPNVSSSFSMINGKVDQEASYSFILRALAIGNQKIREAQVTVGEAVYTTEEKSIHILENPNGDIMDQLEEKKQPPKKYKKKRKTYKI